MSAEGDGLSYHTFEDIGRYTVFQENHWRRMFPTHMYGTFEKTEYQRNKTFGVMTREEGLRITNELSRLSLPHERNFDYLALLSFENTEVKEEVLKDDSKFTAVY